MVLYLNYYLLNVPCEYIHALSETFSTVMLKVIVIVCIATAWLNLTTSANYLLVTGYDFICYV